jgi:nucleoid DNA-binding protein
MGTNLMEGSELMQASVRKGREELAMRVQAAMCLPTKKQADAVIDTVVSCLESTLLQNLNSDGFTIKLNGFGKFSVRHKPGGTPRRIGFSGETIVTKMRRKIRFVSLGVLRQREPMGDYRELAR